jgi:hypothetical protein
MYQQLAIIQESKQSAKQPISPIKKVDNNKNIVNNNIIFILI